MSQRRVAVLYGGQSAEHGVSVTSARAVVGALLSRPDAYQVVPIAITRRGEWLWGEGHLAWLQGSDGYDGLPEDQSGEPACIRPGARSITVLGPNGSRELDVDVVFPVLHGPHGEDGTVQGALELTALPYVGCGVAASAVGMDKVLSKKVFEAAGLPQVPYRAYKKQAWANDPEGVKREVEEAIGYPAFVKPANMGSSVGVSRVMARDGLGPAFEEALVHDLVVVVEKGVEGCREIECAVLGNDSPKASVLGEIVPGRDFYDFEAKYIEEGSQLRIPAPLSEEMTRDIQRMAIAGFSALGGAGMARMDFFVSGDGREVYLNEGNTIPGFTPISMYPKLWQHSGVDFTSLVGRLIDLAMERRG